MRTQKWEIIKMNRLADKQVVDIHEMVDDGKVQLFIIPILYKEYLAM
jgi:hypothetical protein